MRPQVSPHRPRVQGQGRLEHPRQGAAGDPGHIRVRDAGGHPEKATKHVQQGRPPGTGGHDRGGAPAGPRCWDLLHDHHRDNRLCPPAAQEHHLGPPPGHEHGPLWLPHETHGRQRCQRGRNGDRTRRDHHPARRFRRFERGKRVQHPEEHHQQHCCYQQRGYLHAADDYLGGGRLGIRVLERQNSPRCGWLRVAGWVRSGCGCGFVETPGFLGSTAFPRSGYRIGWQGRLARPQTTTTASKPSKYAHAHTHAHNTTTTTTRYIYIYIVTVRFAQLFRYRT
mmetsp:Transcript_9273/g.19447  ORF Transcript_9273/g.19447 Transcript_9273/m.19447 type:complete len:281 (-) Transcript_9273:64-906(-)